MDSTTIKGFLLLEHLTRSDMPQSVAALAISLQLPKSNIHRTLTTLVALGYAKQDRETGRYAPTLRSWELGVRVIGRDPLRRAATPFLQSLHRQTGESVNLTVLDGHEVVYLDKIATHHPIVATADTGWRVPAIYPASGRILLAHAADVVSLLHIISEQVPGAEAIDAADALRQLALIRRRGHAISLSGWRPGINSIAVRIPLPEGSLPASVSVSGPAERLTKAAMMDLLASLQGACAHIGETLGGTVTSNNLFGKRILDTGG